MKVILRFKLKSLLRLLFIFAVIYKVVDELVNQST